jgi:hypothetical protein
MTPIDQLTAWWTGHIYSGGPGNRAVYVDGRAAAWAAVHLAYAKQGQRQQ